MRNVLIDFQTKTQKSKALKMTSYPERHFTNRLDSLSIDVLQVDEGGNSARIRELEQKFQESLRAFEIEINSDRHHANCSVYTGWKS